MFVTIVQIITEIFFDVEIKSFINKTQKSSLTKVAVIPLYLVKQSMIIVFPQLVSIYFW